MRSPIVMIFTSGEFFIDEIRPLIFGIESAPVVALPGAWCSCCFPWSPMIPSEFSEMVDLKSVVFRKQGNRPLRKNDEDRVNFK